jgi:single-strand DNA-binding protein
LFAVIFREERCMVNAVMLVGRAGRDPEMRYFESGRVKTTFSLAVNRPTKEKETDWFDIELWGRQAEVAGEYVRKGSLIGVEGRLDFSRWTDDAGVKHVKPLVHGINLRLLGSKRDGAGGGGGPDMPESF